MLQCGALLQVHTTVGAPLRKHLPAGLNPKILEQLEAGFHAASLQEQKPHQQQQPGAAPNGGGPASLGAGRPASPPVPTVARRLAGGVASTSTPPPLPHSADAGRGVPAASSAALPRDSRYGAAPAVPKSTGREPPAAADALGGNHHSTAPKADARYSTTAAYPAGSRKGLLADAKAPMTDDRYGAGAARQPGSKRSQPAAAASVTADGRYSAAPRYPPDRAGAAQLADGRYNSVATAQPPDGRRAALSAAAPAASSVTAAEHAPDDGHRALPRAAIGAAAAAAGPKVDGRLRYTADDDEDCYPEDLPESASPRGALPPCKLWH